jgi:hypothetical protein
MATPVVPASLRAGVQLGLPSRHHSKESRAKPEKALTKVLTGPIRYIGYGIYYVCYGIYCLCYGIGLTVKSVFRLLRKFPWAGLFRIARKSFNWMYNRVCETVHYF